MQNCWFNLETSLPSIKTSLFERLISGRVQARGRRHHLDEMTAEPVPFAILDEQRRMRSCIADITRPDYEDVVIIRDHSHTKKQLVGDRVTDKIEKTQLIEHRKLWKEDPRSIPGVKVPIYFWNIAENREGRPVAGLSACNPTEATAVVALTKWLITCGVPATSISIITPYKGQKTEIISQLRKAKCLPGFQHHRNQHGSRRPQVAAEENTLTVSTVDRYQGDENDIVILSLVKTQPGNRFVALKNRFIVAVSRARMGFYVIGSVNAVVQDRGGSAGPDHWRRFVSCLEAQKYTDTKNNNIVEKEPSSLAELPNCDDEDDNVDLKSVASMLPSKGSPNAQVGKYFPICCPRHRSCSTLLIDHASKFPSNENWPDFCKEKCSFVNPICEHACGLLCHSPAVTPHTAQSNCTVQVERPCDLHADIALFCRDVVVTEGKLATALKKFKCCVKVKYSRPECSHVTEIECHQYTDILKGMWKLPNCEVRVADFVNPTCNHVSKKPTCIQRREWEKKPPQCCVAVKYTKPCRCVDVVQCWEHIQFLSMATLPLCLHEVEKRRPRCGHILSLRCHASTKIDELWNDQSGESAFDLEQKSGSPLFVQYGIPYGDSESKLLTSSTSSLNRSTEVKIPACMVPVSYKSKCGHVIDAPCSVAFDMAKGHVEETKCNADSELHSPFCGHKVKAPCWGKNALLGIRLWLGMPFPSGETARDCAIPEGQLAAVGQALNHPETGVAQKLRKLLGKACTRSVTIVRSCGREHELKFRCSNLLHALFESGPTGAVALPSCVEPVERLLPCGHSAMVSCHKFHDNPPPVCLTTVTNRFIFPCGVHSVANQPCHVYEQLCNQVDLKCDFSVSVNRYRCKHSIDVPCHLIERATQPVHGAVLVRSIFDDNQEVVVAGVEYCQDDLPPCTTPICFKKYCGHILRNIPCCVAFEWASDPAKVPQCTELVDILRSPLCHHSILGVPCWMANKSKLWKPWKVAEVGVDLDVDEGEVEEGNMINNVEDDLPDEFGQIQSASEENPTDLAVPWDFRAPSVPNFLTAQNIRQFFRCTGTTILVRPCNHCIQMSCVDAFMNQRPPCKEEVIIVCERDGCGCERRYSCDRFEAIRASGLPDPCMNIIQKLCGKCGVNKKAVACSKDNIECASRVTATLTCGHKSSWTCGSDSDPRDRSPLECCKACVFPLWDACINEGKPEDRSLTVDFAKSVQDRVYNFIEQKFYEIGQKYSQFDFMPILLDDVCKHANARTRIMQNFKEAMSKDRVQLSLPPVELSQNHFVEEHYDVVIAPIDRFGKDLKTMKQNFLNNTATIYGRGARFGLLSEDNVKAMKLSADGEISLCVGVAFRLRVLRDASPFIPNINFQGKNGNNLRKKADEEANAKVRMMQDQGFDCVDWMVQKVGKNTFTGDRVYWQAGAVVPVGKVSVKLQYQCVVCQDYYLLKDGLRCASSHFLCWENCFFEYIKAAMEPGAIGRCVDKNGNLTCPGCKDATPYSLEMISASRGPPEALEAVADLRTRILSQRYVTEELEKQEKRLRKEFERIQAIANLDEREANRVRLEIVEEIMTLRCPRCKTAFADFEGCFALRCNPRCGAGICAWCLKDCGSDAHAHVLVCPERRVEGYFAEIELFNEHHARRREKLVRAKFNLQTRDVQAYLRRLLEKDLKDLGITLD